MSTTIDATESDRLATMKEQHARLVAALPAAEADAQRTDERLAVGQAVYDEAVAGIAAAMQELSRAHGGAADFFSGASVLAVGGSRMEIRPPQSPEQQRAADARMREAHGAQGIAREELEGLLVARTTAHQRRGEVRGQIRYLEDQIGQAEARLAARAAQKERLGRGTLERIRDKVMGERQPTPAA